VQAPRTGVGLRADGAVMLLVVDGIETEGEGVDLWEFAEVRFVDCLLSSSRACPRSTNARQPCSSNLRAPIRASSDSGPTLS
jgi:hypothetical protein